MVPGGVAAPRGFLAAGVHTGVKRRRLDLALIVSETPAAAAATYTTNRVKAAPLQLTREHVSRGWIRAIVCNSGNANACNGPKGLEDARKMAQETAEALGILPEEVVVASTGVIGQPMPMDKILPGIREAARALSRDGGSAAAEAITTTDTVPKEIAVSLDIDGVCVTVGGVAKASGMIHPNMPTMLAFLTTDAAVEPADLQGLVSALVDDTFNMITVDGDTSTNDMVVCLANGQSLGPTLRPGTAGWEQFKEALRWVMTYLAKAIARDGEGATKLVEIRVQGAPTRADARRIARSIAGSNLVKTAIYGEDANWGRIFCAVGYSGVEFDPDKVDIYIGELQVAAGGQALPFDEAKASEILRESDVQITVDLHQGSGEATAWTCDLTYDYIKINASYRT